MLLIQTLWNCRASLAARIISLTPPLPTPPPPPKPHTHNTHNPQCRAMLDGTGSEWPSTAGHGSGKLACRGIVFENVVLGTGCVFRSASQTHYFFSPSKHHTS